MIGLVLAENNTTSLLHFVSCNLPDGAHYGNIHLCSTEKYLGLDLHFNNMLEKGLKRDTNIRYIYRYLESNFMSQTSSSSTFSTLWQYCLSSSLQVSSGS